MTLRLGLIGAGPWGRNYIRTIDRLDGIRLARLASRNPQSGGLIGAECDLTPDWRRVAEARDLDGIIVATPPAMHVEMAAVAVSAGLPVLVEKPLAMDPGEACGLKSLAARLGGFVMVDHIHLFHPAFAALKARVPTLGAVRHIRAEAGDDGPYRRDTPVLWDWGAHDVAMCLDLLGRPPRDLAARRLTSEDRGGATAENLRLRLAFPGGVVADLTIGNLFKKRRRFTVHCDGGVLVYDDLAEASLTLYAATPDFADPTGAGEAIPVSGDPPLERVVRAFAEAATAGSTDSTGLELGVEVVRVLADCARLLPAP